MWSGGGAFWCIGGSSGNLASFAFRKSRWKSLMAAVVRDLRRNVVYFISNKEQERRLGCRVDLTGGFCTKMVFLCKRDQPW